jgi:hypothetical protein
MRSSMKKIASIVMPLLVVLALGLAACGQTSSGSSGGAPAGASANEIDMAATMFVQSDLTIASGQSVHFVDQQSGTMHILCVYCASAGMASASRTRTRHATSRVPASRFSRDNRMMCGSRRTEPIRSPAPFILI